MVSSFCALVRFNFRGQEKAVFVRPKDIKGLSDQQSKLSQVKLNIIEPTEIGRREARFGDLVTFNNFPASEPIKSMQKRGILVN